MKRVATKGGRWPRVNPRELRHYRAAVEYEYRWWHRRHVFKNVCAVVGLAVVFFLFFAVIAGVLFRLLAGAFPR